jgi:hypothetical protein
VCMCVCVHVCVCVCACAWGLSMHASVCLSTCTYVYYMHTLGKIYAWLCSRVSLYTVSVRTHVQVYMWYTYSSTRVKIQNFTTLLYKTSLDISCLKNSRERRGFIGLAMDKTCDFNFSALHGRVKCNGGLRFQKVHKTRIKLWYIEAFIWT